MKSCMLFMSSLHFVQANGGFAVCATLDERKPVVHWKSFKGRGIAKYKKRVKLLVLGVPGIFTILNSFRTDVN